MTGSSISVSVNYGDPSQPVVLTIMPIEALAGLTRWDTALSVNEARKLAALLIMECNRATGFGQETIQ